MSHTSKQTEFEHAKDIYTDNIVHENVEGDHAVLVVRDENPESPREWDNFGTLIASHRNYDYTDGGAALPKGREFSGWEEIEQYLRKERGAVALLPVYAYIHSGITINTTGFSCPFESGRLGVIYTTREKLLKEFNTKRVTKALLKKAEHNLRCEVEVLDQYLTGDVYGIIQFCEGRETDACWGYFGLDYARNEANAALKHAIHEATRARTDEELGQLFLQFDPGI